MTELDAMWDALAALQPGADQEGYGDQWRAMLTERTDYSAFVASFAVDVEGRRVRAPYADLDASFAANAGAVPSAWDAADAAYNAACAIRTHAAVLRHTEAATRHAIAAAKAR